MDLFRNIQKERKGIETESCGGKYLGRIRYSFIVISCSAVLFVIIIAHHRRTLGHKAAQELDTVYHLKADGFRL